MRNSTTLPYSLPRALGLWLPVLVGLLMLMPPLAAISHAQMTTAITPTTGTGNLGTNVNQSGNVFNITGGTRASTNLFHSFNQFSVGVQSGVNDIANFQNTQINGSFPSTSNIFSRVTGGQPSSIFGTIQTSYFGSANLYLINPAGVLFGSTASLNVQGSFHVSTADYIRFNDPSAPDVSKPRFYADPVKSSILTSFSPDAFGFLDPHPAAIAIQGSTLQVPDGQTLSVVGGNVTIQGGTLSAPNGRVQIAGVGSPTGAEGEVVIRTSGGAPDFQLSGFDGTGQVQLVNDPAPVLSGTTVATEGSLTNLDGTYHITLLEIGDSGKLDAVIPLHGPDYSIPGDKGKFGGDLGANWFLTFSRFDLIGGETATFQSPGITINNILSRVIGGQPSVIDGTLNWFPDATLYFLNPAGVSFRANAQIGPHVTGSFHVSTADYLRLGAPGAAGSGIFYADATKLSESVLTAASPTAFGFTSSTPAPISVQGSALAVPEGQTLSLIGGDISIQGNAEFTNFGIATLDAPRGQILLASVASAGEVILGPVEQGKGLQMEGFNALGTITVAPGSLINTAGESGGTVVIRGGKFTIDGSFIFSDTLGGQNGAPLAIDAQLTGDAHIVNGSQITADIVGQGNAGDIVMAAKSLTIEGENSAVHSIDFGGAGGATANIVVHANDLVLTSGGAIYTTTSGSGNAGNITLNVGTLTTSVYDPLATSIQATIASHSFGFATPPGLADGKAGDITITASGPIILNNTSVVSNGCFCVPGFGFGTGQGGSITLTSGPGPTSQIALNETNVSANVNDLAPGASSGTPSRITVTADALSMTGNFPLSGGISSQTFGSAPAGNIVINVKTLRSFPGVEDGFNVAGIGSSTGNGGTVPAGPAGNVTIKGPDPNNPNDAATLIDLNGEGVGTASFGRSSGASAGNITITADTVILTRMGLATSFRGEVVQTGGGIFSETDGPAPAGNIIFNVRTLLSNVTRDGTLIPATAKDLIPTPQYIAEFDNLPPGTWVDQNVISSRSTGQFVSLPKNSNPHDPTVGRPGSVIIKGPDPTNPNDAATLVALNNTLLLTTMSGGTSNSPPGHISISAETLALTNGTQVLADTSGAAPAGNITLNVGTLASNIQVHGPNGNLIPLNDAARVLIKSTSTGLTGLGRAGTITIRGTDSTETVSAPAALVALNNTTLSTVAGNAVSSSAMPAHISIIADTVNLSNGTQITADTSGAAPAGDITLTATKTFSLADGRISVATTGPGDAGAVRLTAGESVSLTSSVIDSEAAGFGLGHAGEVVITAPTVSLEAFSAITTLGVMGGPVTITASQGVSLTDASIESSTFLTGGQGGKVTVTAPTVSLTRSRIASDTFGSGDPGESDAGNIELNVGRLTLTDTEISSSNQSGTGRAGNITIRGVAGVGSQAEEVTIAFSGQTFEIPAQLNTSTSGLGNAGNISVDTARLTLRNGGTIGSSSVATDSSDDVGRPGTVTVRASQEVLIDGKIQEGPGIFQLSGITVIGGIGVGEGGNIAVTTPVLTLSDGGLIQASTIGTRNAGAVEINAGTVTLSAGGQIQSSTLATPAVGIIPTGAGGTVTVQGQAGAGSRAGSVVIAGTGSGIFTDTQGTGPGGNIAVHAQSVTVQDGGTLSAATSGSATTATGGTITVNANQVQLNNGASISASSTGPGNAGSITIQGLASPADSVTLTNSTIATSAESTGRGGSISVDATNLMLNNGTISASVKDFNAADPTDSAAVGLGNIALTASTLTMSGGTITAATTGTRNAGTLTLNASSLNVNSGTLTTGTSSSGNAGSIEAKVGTINLTGNSAISSSSTGTGDAGNISIQAVDSFVSRNSTVTTSTTQSDGGNIIIKAGNLVQLDHSEITTSVQGGAGNGGNINIDPPTVIVNSSKIIASAIGGKGGNINIVAGVFLVSPDSIIDASSTFGVSGTITIESPITNLSGTLAPLPGEIVQVAGLLQARCAARLAGGTSGSFVVAGRDGLPLEPGGMLPSPLYVESPRRTRMAGSLDIPGLRVGRMFVESNWTLVPLAIGCSS